MGDPSGHGGVRSDVLWLEIRKIRTKQLTSTVPDAKNLALYTY